MPSDKLHLGEINILPREIRRNWREMATTEWGRLWPK